MLRTRVITALVLVAVLLLVLTVARPWGFPIFALAAVVAVIVEWLSLLGLSRTTSVVAAGVMAFALWMVGSSVHGPLIASWVMTLAVALWVLLSAGLFATGRFPPAARWPLPHALLALLMPAACWFALVEAYRAGLPFLLSILAIVWAADVAAYFAGRAFGRRKLAPSISPGKTWAGAIGGAVAALVLAAAVIAWPGVPMTWFAMFAARASVAAMLVVVLALVAVSVVGDLFESQLKRQRGVKDSGRLLPGHGGVFDRVDALLPVVPAAVLLALNFRSP